MGEFQFLAQIRASGVRKAQQTVLLFTPRCTQYLLVCLHLAQVAYSMHLYRRFSEPPQTDHLISLSHRETAFLPEEASRSPSHRATCLLWLSSHASSRWELISNLQYPSFVLAELSLCPRLTLVYLLGSLLYLASRSRWQPNLLKTLD